MPGDLLPPFNMLDANTCQLIPKPKLQLPIHAADGADGSHVFVAMRKALAAWAFAMPSSDANKLVTTDKQR